MRVLRKENGLSLIEFELGKTAYVTDLELKALEDGSLEPKFVPIHRPQSLADHKLEVPAPAAETEAEPTEETHA